jgi:hypothetical protein
MLPLSIFFVCCSVCIQFALWQHFSWAHNVSASVCSLQLFIVVLLANVTLDPMRVIMSSVAQTKKPGVHSQGSTARTPHLGVLSQKATARSALFADDLKNCLGHRAGVICVSTTSFSIPFAIHFSTLLSVRFEVVLSYTLGGFLVLSCCALETNSPNTVPVGCPACVHLHSYTSPVSDSCCSLSFPILSSPLLSSLLFSPLLFSWLRSCVGQKTREVGLRRK